MRNNFNLELFGSLIGKHKKLSAIFILLFFFIVVPLLYLLVLSVDILDVEEQINTGGEKQATRRKVLKFYGTSLSVITAVCFTVYAVFFSCDTDKSNDEVRVLKQTFQASNVITSLFTLISLAAFKKISLIPTQSIASFVASYDAYFYLKLNADDKKKDDTYNKIRFRMYALNMIIMMSVNFINATSLSFKNKVIDSLPFVTIKFVAGFIILGFILMKIFSLTKNNYGYIENITYFIANSILITATVYFIIKEKNKNKEEKKDSFYLTTSILLIFLFSNILLMMATNY